MTEVRPHAGARGVLLLCQSEETLGALSAILERAGETVIPHTGLSNAWERIKEGVVGCVVLDAEAPATEALAFFLVTRSSAQTRDIPFLFLVGGDIPVPQLDRIGPEVAPDAWLELPCSADQFLKQIRALLVYKPPPLPTPPAPRPETNAEYAGRPPSSPGVVTATSPASQSATAEAETIVSPEELLNAQGSVFAGRLGVLDVTKIVSMVEPLRLTGVLKLSDGKRYGQVHFIEGAVRHAALHEIEGPDALFLLFHLKTGAFRFEVGAPTERRTIEGNTMALLLEGLRQMDEAKALIKSFQQRRTGGSGAAAAVATG
ncbi:MAG: DUF4388 domain-containing protein [Planctomycetota bacterium]|nr:DUF4388 domain-containing protein [Planctomycetota bacterium]